MIHIVKKVFNVLIPYFFGVSGYGWKEDREYKKKGREKEEKLIEVK